MENAKKKYGEFTATYTSISKYTDQLYDGFIPSVVGKIRTLDFINLVPDVAYSKVIPTVSTTFDLIDASSCAAFTNHGTSSVTGVTLTTCFKKYEEQFCTNEMSQYYFGPYMKNNYEDVPFEAAFIDEKVGKLAKALDKMFWQGGDSCLANGIITTATQSGASTVTATFSVSTAATNGVIATFDQMVSKLDTDLLSEDDLVLFVGQDTFDNYTRSIRNLNFFHFSPDEINNGVVKMFGKRNVTIVATVGLDGYGKALLTKGSWIFWGTDINPGRDEQNLPIKAQYSEYLDAVIFRMKIKIGSAIAFPTYAVVAQ